ncbi:hypothetical protein [Cohnella rhizosphaerae]|uniref:Uncharacterized protein n=1 Tax=Cohnella rhizosphaerae TaxID=1457232 RepID=A0A9X4KZQ9_9BACL|nr:hypothetical protein [Cohnella rhizosphaerae]MDG0811059.1 hypothetical protein [Cohnella rhizosphaerae]
MRLDPLQDARGRRLIPNDRDRLAVDHQLDAGRMRLQLGAYLGGDCRVVELFAVGFGILVRDLPVINFVQNIAASLRQFGRLRGDAAFDDIAVADVPDVLAADPYFRI